MMTVETTPAEAPTPAEATTPDGAGVRVDYLDGDRFTIAIRGHEVIVDQPVAAGGGDLGPTPTELLVASLASCVGFYTRRYLHRHGLDAAGLTVAASYVMASKPSRVGDVSLSIVVPAGVPDGRRAALLSVAEHCTVHNTLVAAPDVVITLGA